MARPITKIQKLPYPHLGWVRNATSNLPGPLHIADKQCEQNGSKWLARCGRAIQFSSRFNDGISKRPAELDGFALCKRCGSQADFETALEQHKAGDATRRAEYRARREAEDAEYEREHQERLARIERLKPLLNVVFHENKHYLITIEHEGYLYHITEGKQIPRPSETTEQE